MYAISRVWFTFTLYNILSFIFGLLVTGVSAWLVADRGSFFYVTQLDELELEYSSGTFIDDGAYIILGIGVAILVQSFVGCLGAGMGCGGKGRGCLFTYGGFLVLVIVLEILVVVLVLAVYIKELSEEAKVFVESTLKDYLNTETGVSVVWDNMMEGLGCCGANNYTDFQQIYIEGVQQVPDSCCLKNGTTVLDTTCTEDPTTLNAHLDGCFAMLAPSATPALAVTTAIVVVFQIAGVILSLCLAKHVEVKQEWYQMTTL